LLIRQQNESPFIQEVVREHAKRTALIPWQIEPPIGGEALKKLTEIR